jgi:hypothetical protein
MATRPSSSSIDRQKAESKPRSVSASHRPSSGPHENEQAAKGQSPTAVQPVEPEDAYLTGVSRSLQRRLLGLNVQGSQGQSKPLPEASTAGLHSTGSFTDSQGVKPSDSAKDAKKSKGK